MADRGPPRQRLPWRVALESARRGLRPRPAVLRPSGAAAVQRQAVLKQPDRVWSERVASLRSLKLLRFRSKATARVQRAVPENTNPTNNIYPNRRRSLFPCRPKIGVQPTGRFAIGHAQQPARPRSGFVPFSPSMPVCWCTSSTNRFLMRCRHGADTAADDA